MVETIHVGHEPDTYRAYKTIGGWKVSYMDREGNTRDADGSKVYKHRQNAYAAVKRLNHPIAHAIKKTGMCEAYWDGKTLVVRENEDDKSLKDIYTLYISVGAMPPYCEEDFETPEAAEEYIRKETYFPLYIGWESAEFEG